MYGCMGVDGAFQACDVYPPPRMHLHSRNVVQRRSSARTVWRQVPQREGPSQPHAQPPWIRR